MVEIDTAKPILGADEEQVVRKTSESPMVTSDNREVDGSLYSQQDEHAEMQKFTHYDPTESAWQAMRDFSW